MPHHGPTEIFKKDAETINNLLMELWIPHHPSLAHLPLSNLELRFNQGNYKGMFSEEIRDRRDHKPE